MEPLFFIPFFEEKAWGGQRLSRLYAKYPAGIDIGESWELSSVLYRQTFVRDGNHSGVMLSELYKKYPEYFGTEEPYFPFVIKFVDARTAQPVLIHGSGMKDAGTQEEGVYIVEAQPAAKVVSGTKLESNIALFDAIAAENLESSLNYLEVDTGDSFIVKPGTLHALCGGVLAYTVTSPLAETGSVYDWGRSGDLRLDHVMDAIRYRDNISLAPQVDISEKCSLILRCERFALEKINASEPVNDQTEARFSVFTALAAGQINYAGRAKNFRAGDTFIVPAGFGAFTLTGGDLLKTTPLVQTV